MMKFYLLIIGFCLCLKDIISTNLVYPSSPLSPSQLLHDIHQAIANNASSYLIASGIYNFSTFLDLSFTLTSPTNFILSGNNNVLLIFAPRQGISITNGTNVTISGITIDYSPLAFTQGVISNTSYFNGYHILFGFTFILEPEYPSIEFIQSLGESKVYFYNASTRFMFHDQVETSPVLHNFTSFGNGIYYVFASMPSTLLGWHPTSFDTLATISASPNPAIQCQGCENLVLEDITLHSSSGMGFVEMGGVGNTIIRHWNAIPPPTTLPPIKRLLVTTLDGIHSTSVQKGLSLLDSTVRFSGDDAFAVHCELGISWGIPTEGNDSELYVIDTGGNIARTVAFAKPGEELLFFALNNTMTPLGKAIIQSNSIEPNNTLQMEAANATADIQKQLHITIRPLTINSTLLMRMSFTSPLSPNLRSRFAALVQYTGRCGLGTNVKNTTLTDSSGGMRLKGINVSVSSSTIARAYGMRMLPEPFWTQSTSFNISIINNIFHECGHAPASPDAISYLNETCTGLVLINNTFYST
jgi:hypothetical protein